MAIHSSRSAGGVDHQRPEMWGGVLPTNNPLWVLADGGSSLVAAVAGTSGFSVWPACNDKHSVESGLECAHPTGDRGQGVSTSASA